MKDFESMTNEEVSQEIRKSLRNEFPDTAFRVDWDGEHLDINIIGGELYGLVQLSCDVQDRIQNAIFLVAPIIMYFEESDFV